MTVELIERPADLSVVISMTTIPSRLNSLKPTLDSLLAQTMRCPQIWINMPPNCAEFWDDLDRGWRAKYDILDERIDVNYMDRDYGPVTKLGAWAKTPIIAKMNRLGPNALIITVDDDIEYQPTWLATIIVAAQQHPDAALGFSGWNVDNFLAGTGSYKFAGVPSTCDVLEGWAGAAYRKRFFDGIDILNSPPAFQFVDDVWISSQLNKRGIARRLIAHPMAKPFDPDAPGLHKRLDFVELNRHAARAGFGGKTCPDVCRQGCKFSPCRKGYAP